MHQWNSNWNLWCTSISIILYKTLLACWWVRMEDLSRNMPVILPDQLYGWMIRAGIFPTMDDATIRGYWKHLKETGSPLGNMSDGTHIPVFLWGDGAQYTVTENQSMMVFACGFVLDDNRSNIFPLWMCREEPCFKFMYIFYIWMCLQWFHGQG